MDVRERVVAAVVQKGWSQGKAAEVYGVSRASVGRFVRAAHAGASLQPKQGGGRRRRWRLPEHVEALRALLQAQPDMERAARREHLADAEGARLSVPTFWRAIRTLGWTRKKRPSPPPSRTR